MKHTAAAEEEGVYGNDALTAHTFIRSFIHDVVLEGLERAQ
jgi:hypothetical protein